MNRYIESFLNDNYRSNISPFFWQHGEDEATLRQYMRKIHESNVSSVCIESRPHPDFCGEKWWNDFDIILDEAKKLDMQVWLLDDAKFPTGYANGWIKDKFPEKGKVYLHEKHLDIKGEQKAAALTLESFYNMPMFGAVGNLLAVVAAKKTGNGEEIEKNTQINLTDKVHENMLYWDIPNGEWRVYILYLSKNGGKKDYINLTDKESVRVLIDAVYEPHFEHYKDDFGKTFRGFFSDEPELGNYEGNGTFGMSFVDSIGRTRISLPWGAEIQENLITALGEDYLTLLPNLWYECSDNCWQIRHSFMDIVTKLIKKNFSEQIGDWCRGHGVQYIGHVIEDQNAHTKLSVGTGHYFRATKGMDMAGIDVVMHQIRPEMDGKAVTWLTGELDAEFMYYGLGKMASSSAHIDPIKKGRTMCEVYGAYGWGEGTRLMKWVTDHLIVRGVNHLVPHGFNPAPFPDGDCPPHFYAHGNNPQFKYFGKLMKYAGRLCELFSDGIHVSQVAVLYHAQAEWSGDDYMMFQVPIKELLQNQIDCDVIPTDVFEERDYYGTKFAGGKLFINGESYKALIIPTSKNLPKTIIDLVNEANKNNFPVYFIDKAPTGYSDISEKLVYKNFSVVALSELAEKLDNLREIRVSEPTSELRYYHYKKADLDIFMFFYENIHKSLHTTVSLPTSRKCCKYDALTGELYSIQATDGKINLSLAPYETAVYIFGDVDGKPLPIIPTSRKVIDEEWEISLSEPKEYPNFTSYMKTNEFFDITAYDKKPHFAGTIKYTTTFKLDLSAINKDNVWLDLGEVYESADLIINGKLAGSKFANPYIFNITDFIQDGNNRIEIEVTNTLGRKMRDFISRNAILEPSGLLSKVEILFNNR